MAETPSEKIAKEMLARFPITHPNVPYTNVTEGAKPFDVAVDNFKISLNKTAPDAEIGRYDATIKVHTGSDTEGFQGGAWFRFLDDKGNVVFAMLGDIYGVNGKLIPGQPNRVEKQESKFIPVDILTAVHKIEIFPVRLEGQALDNLKKTISELEKGAEAIRDGIKTIGASVVEIIAAIKAFG